MRDFDYLIGLFYTIMLILGYVIGSSRCKQPQTNEELEQKIDKLEKEIEYYKDLCLWHVKEKEKLKETK